MPAPMCGISDYAFRTVCRDHGGPMAFTQMVAAEGMAREHKKTLSILDLPGDEPIIGMQVFGCDPVKLADAAHKLEDLGATVVDLNMGCPARKVTGSMGGSALLREPALVAKIFHAMRAAVTVPLTVKMRWDWDDGEGAALAVARMAEAEGLDGLCLHARTREEGYSGEADWERIKELKESVSLPVVGNGDVRSPEDAVEMMRMTGCDGVMIGRAAMGGPWLLGAALAAVRREIQGHAVEELPGADPDWESRRLVMLRHARLMVERKGPKGLIEFRKHAAAYMRGVRGAKRLRKEMMGITDVASLERALLNPAALVMDEDVIESIN